MSTTAKLSVVIAVLFVCQPVFGQGKRGRLAGFGQGNQDANAATDANGGGAGFGRRRIDRGTGGPNADQRTGTGGAAPAAGRGGQFTRGLGAAPSPGASPAAGGFQRGGGGGIETALKRFDTNNDGMIDAKEAADPTAKTCLTGSGAGWERNRTTQLPSRISHKRFRPGARLVRSRAIRRQRRLPRPLGLRCRCRAWALERLRLLPRASRQRPAFCRLAPAPTARRLPEAQRCLPRPRRSRLRKN